MSRRLSAGGSKVIFPAVPVRLAPNGSSLHRFPVSYSSFSTPDIRLLGYHITFWRFVNRFMQKSPEKSRNCSPYADLCTVRTWRTQSRLRLCRRRAAVHFTSDRLASRGSAALQNFRLLPEKPRLLTVVPPWKTLPPERGPSSVLRGVLRTVEWV